MKHFFVFAASFWFLTSLQAQNKIDREAVVRRHNIVSSADFRRSPAQVGNGRFAFGMDVTGLQTFVPFNTMSDWAWHSFPLPKDMQISDYKPVEFTTHGKKIKYQDYNYELPEISSYLTCNPHRFNLARIGLKITNEKGEELSEKNIRNNLQTVDLWTGIVSSRFECLGNVVNVETVCHPNKDMIAVNIKSDLIASGKISVFIDFPYPDSRYQTDFVGRYDTVEAHTTNIEHQTTNTVCIAHQMDDVKYFTGLHWNTKAKFEREKPEFHKYILKPDGGNELSFTCRFSQDRIGDDGETVEQVKQLSAQSWKNFWQSGAAVDFSGSKDYRWFELERRVVLSQYLMRVNECGIFPPQESGLVNNGWYGRFHFEMIWWHGVHWALWNRQNFLNSYLDVYKKFLPEARNRAREEGRKGARWPKCTGNFNREWPGKAHAFILWHEPHPIYFAEMEYRQNPTRETLEKWKDIVLETAEYMADGLFYDKKSKTYVMGPPIVIVSENTKPMETINPTFELSYWRYGLRTAIEWRKRLNLPNEKHWEEVLTKIARLPVENDVYVTYEGIDSMWTKYTYEHPALTGVFGMLPGDGVDTLTFRRTLEKVVAGWQFDRVWGWDFPMVAMAAARTGRPDIAVDMLMHSSYRFQFDEHGYSTSWPFPYFPANGGLLTAIAMMCGGWDGSVGDAPGFPKDGSWNVKYEGFQKMQ